MPDNNEERKDSDPASDLPRFPYAHDLYGSSSTSSSTQVIHHPNQVATRDQLVVGQKYLRYFAEGFFEEITIVSKPYPRRGMWWIRMTSRTSDIPIEVALAELGIMPYENGKWNATNYFVPVDD